MLVLTQSFNPFGVASKPTRNGIVHPMIPFIIATALTCSESEDLISKMQKYRISEEARSEMIQIVKDSAAGECDWDAKAD